jgi:hypothetical protein
MSIARFVPARRERLLTLLETGRSMEDACSEAAVSRSTVSKWAARGRLPGAEPDMADFARRLDAIREGRNAPLPTEDDVLRMAARAARKGSVQAMKLLLVELRRRRESGESGDEENPFAALDGLYEFAPKSRRAS